MTQTSTFEELANVDLMCDRTGYIALDMTKRFPRVEIPKDTHAFFYDPKKKLLIRVDEKGDCHGCDKMHGKPQEWTRLYTYTSFSFILRLSNKGLRPVSFTLPK